MEKEYTFLYHEGQPALYIINFHNDHANVSLNNFIISKLCILDNLKNSINNLALYYYLFH